MIHRDAESIDAQLEQSSFRDPCGFLFWRESALYRQVNPAGADDYDFLMKSGLYKELVARQWLIPHTEVSLSNSPDGKAYRILRPEMVPYISYPYEWCFEQYRDAALLTLDIALRALDSGAILKDSSTYNIQFRGASPVLIDTLSFARYRDGQTWHAYGQFCRHFLVPLLLMGGVSPACSKLAALYIDGVPLDFAVSLLGGRWKWRPSVYLHLYLHARKVASAEQKPENIRISLISLKAIIRSLRKLIGKLNPSNSHTEWATYYDTMHNYSDAALREKGMLVAQFLAECGAKFVCDLGANRGDFSKYAAERTASYVIAYDMDHSAVNRHYTKVKADRSVNVLPLILDLTNPSAGIGWANEERASLEKRACFDCVMVLALIHHLVISNNVSLEKVAEYLSRLGRHLIIEFIPRTDSQVLKLLNNREDIFDSYTELSFEHAFAKFFELVRKESIAGSKRMLYLFKTNSMKGNLRA